jgi:hypothetical protein
VCGPGRAPGDGLGIRPGPVGTESRVASPWIPDASLGVAGVLRTEFVWAALDCPGGFAAVARRRSRPVLLGRISAELRTDVPTGRPLVVQGWRICQEGRKHIVGTAIHRIDGACLAVANAIWFEV